MSLSCSCASLMNQILGWSLQVRLWARTSHTNRCSLKKNSSKRKIERYVLATFSEWIIMFTACWIVELLLHFALINKRLHLSIMSCGATVEILTNYCSVVTYTEAATLVTCRTQNQIQAVYIDASNSHWACTTVLGSLCAINQSSKQAVSLIKIWQTQIMTTAWIWVQKWKWVK